MRGSGDECYDSKQVESMSADGSHCKSVCSGHLTKMRDVDCRSLHVDLTDADVIEATSIDDEYEQKVDPMDSDNLIDILNFLN